MATQLIMAKTPEEAIAAGNEASVFLAGGTEVNRLGSGIPETCDVLISLKQCSGLSDIEADGCTVRIGSMCTFQQLAESDAVPAYLREAALFMASRTRRNMATIGGNIALLRTDSYIMPALLAADACLELLDKGGTLKTVRIEDYLAAPEKAALITKVVVPGECRLISKRYSNTAQSHAVLTMSASLGEKGFILAAAVKGSGLLRFYDLEKAASGRPDMTEEEIMDWFRAYDGINIEDDMFGSETYKRYLLGVTAADMLKKLAACSEGSADFRSEACCCR